MFVNMVNNMSLQLQILDESFAVCSLDKKSMPMLDADFIFYAKTDEELSLVCPEKLIPSSAIKYEKGWRAIRITGILDFSIIGILSKISGILAENRIGIFVVSTYNTDYILVKGSQLHSAIKALKENGYVLI